MKRSILSVVVALASLILVIGRAESAQPKKGGSSGSKRSSTHSKWKGGSGKKPGPRTGGVHKKRVHMLHGPRTGGSKKPAYKNRAPKTGGVHKKPNFRKPALVSRVHRKPDSTKHRGTGGDRKKPNYRKPVKPAVGYNPKTIATAGYKANPNRWRKLSPKTRNEVSGVFVRIRSPKLLLAVIDLYLGRPLTTVQVNDIRTYLNSRRNGLSASEAQAVEECLDSYETEQEDNSSDDENTQDGGDEQGDDDDKSNADDSGNADDKDEEDDKGEDDTFDESLLKGSLWTRRFKLKNGDLATEVLSLSKQGDWEYTLMNGDNVAQKEVAGAYVIEDGKVIFNVKGKQVNSWILQSLNKDQVIVKTGDKQFTRTRSWTSIKIFNPKRANKG